MICFTNKAQNEYLVILDIYNDTSSKWHKSSNFVIGTFDVSNGISIATVLGTSLPWVWECN